MDDSTAFNATALGGAAIDGAVGDSTVAGAAPSDNGRHDGAPQGAVAGYVHSVETGGTVDGPGVRYVVFTTGCPLRCAYCHNPDTQHLKSGNKTTSDAVVADIARYVTFLRRAHGGVTLSGGEPLTQPDFVTAILKGCKALGLHTALDTSGFLGARATPAMLDATDLVLLDIKSFDPALYHRLTSVDLAPTLAFAQRLSDMGKAMWIRFVLVPGITDDAENVAGLASFVSGLRTVERVEVLPYHRMGEEKWKALGRSYTLAGVPTPTAAQVAAVEDIFAAHGLAVA